MYKFLLKKHYKSFQLDVDFTLDKEETLVILGPSGCGKSTILNLITGITDLDDGYIMRGEEYLAKKDASINCPIYRRRIGYIQQKSNLFPHMTVKDNICYGLKDKKDESALETLETYLQIFQLEDKMHMKPSELSGGQRQRVSIIRAIMSKPDLLLFDEPFSALDNPLRIALRDRLIAIKEKLKVPIIFVTHDLEEGHALGDRIMIMDNGHIVETGTTNQIYHAPKKLQTARLLGVENIWDGHVEASNGHRSKVIVDGMTLDINHELPTMQKVTVGIKASDIFYIKRYDEDPDKYTNVFLGKIIDMKRSYQGYILSLAISCFKGLVYLQLPEYVIYNNQIERGDSIHICMKYKGLILLE